MRNLVGPAFTSNAIFVPPQTTSPLSPPSSVEYPGSVKRQCFSGDSPLVGSSYFLKSQNSNFPSVDVVTNLVPVFPLYQTRSVTGS